MIARVIETWQAVEAFAFPQLCPGCASPAERGKLLCERCWSRIPECGIDLCARCLASETPTAACAKHPGFRVRSARLYDERMAAVVTALKFEGRLDLVPIAAHIMAEAVVHPPDLVIPVPLHAARLRERGFNPAALLGQAVADSLGSPFLAAGLERVRPTRAQARLSAGRRRRNVAGAFRVVSPKVWAGRSVLVVDDVITTGATLESCLQELESCGARGSGLTLAWAQ